MPGGVVETAAPPQWVFGSLACHGLLLFVFVDKAVLGEHVHVLFLPGPGLSKVL